MRRGVAPTELPDVVFEPVQEVSWSPLRGCTSSPTFAPTEPMLLALILDSYAENPGDGAGIRLARDPKAPRNLIVVLRSNERPVSLVTMTMTAPAGRTSATIVVRNDVIPAVGRIMARANPRDRRHLCPGWTCIDCTTTAATQRPVDCTVTPIIATGRITGILRIACFQGRLPATVWIHRRTSGPGIRAARDRQQWQATGSDYETAQQRQHRAPRRAASKGTAPQLNPLVKMLHTTSPPR